MAGLVIMRRRNESFFIGDNIKITAIECRQGSVRLQIEAPKEVTIVRDEIVDDSALRAKRAATVANLRHELAKAEKNLSKIQGNEADIEDLGRRRGQFLEEDEVADAFVEETMIDHGV